MEGTGVVQSSQTQTLTETQSCPILSYVMCVMEVVIEVSTVHTRLAKLQVHVTMTTEVT